MNRSVQLVVMCVVMAGCLAIARAEGDDSAKSSLFHPPVRIQADGATIDTGPDWGHSSPCIEDLDGDGLKDLVVGDFQGKFHWYRNAGTPNDPSFQSAGHIQAGGVDAQVWIYCCIGAQARFCDLDGDGIRDMLSNSYDPGHCYLFRGLPGHQFAAREELLDKAGVPVRSVPVQQQTVQSFGSFYEPVDWDDDGDFDLLIGCFEGQLKLRINEGTVKKPEFATENVVVNTVDGPLKVKAHLCPVAADWDNDGLWDIIAGCDDGSVTWFRNVGKKGAPAFAAGQPLVEQHPGHGYNLVRWNDHEIVPGIRSQIEVTDLNGDGKLDLLLGDFYTAYDFKPDLSEDQKQEINTLTTESDSLAIAFSGKMEALRKEFHERYPGDEIFSDKATKEWTQAYRALQEGPEAKQMEADEKIFVKKMRPFLRETHGPGDRSYELAKSHGHVWLYVRQ